MQILPGEKRDLVENGARFSAGACERSNKTAATQTNRGFAVTVNYTTGERPVFRPKRSHFLGRNSQNVTYSQKVTFSWADLERGIDSEFGAS